MEHTAPALPRPTTTIRHDTPIGTLTLAATELGLVSSSFTPPDKISTRLSIRAITGTDSPAAQTWLDQTRTELDQYFAGNLRAFTVPVDLQLAGTLDRSLLAVLAQVPYGATTSYGRLGARLGLPPEDIRKVGQAMARNPVLILLPCHRVLGADGTLVGYAAGLPAKRRLLDLESNQSQLDLNLTA
ncbi:MAG TPA: methylated-DNA--[protein]-cysteine S-methyltransferase [Pseudonocardiaceae bacterium]|nr:methylated-DNA--[protein]-cysteine S-methyltransferase [Pseudonocardiaceae bacterium]